MIADATIRAPQRNPRIEMTFSKLYPFPKEEADPQHKGEHAGNHDLKRTQSDQECFSHGSRSNALCKEMGQYKFVGRTRGIQ